MSENISIKDFFIGQDVFITGCTGLAGKALVEKIIRTCTGVSKLFLLIRDLKDKSCEQRLEALKSSRVFDRVRKENPKALDKLIPVSGDLSEIGLGLSQSSIKMMENVSIVYHVAATVRFDEPLKNAILLNVRGTREVCCFATALKNLKIFVHVSTIYSNPYLKHVEEKLYPQKFDWRSVIKIAETMNNELLNALTCKIIKDFPNTYTFTKHLAESVVNDFRHQMDIAIVRPSIVHSAGYEPFPGWYDNYNGIMGLVTGTYTGVVRGFYCNPDLVIDVVPLDDVVKMTINCGWWQLYHEHNDRDEVSIYNLASSNVRSYSVGTMIDLSNQMIDKCAFNKCLWYPNFGATNCVYNFYLRIYLFHVLPAIFIDMLLRMYRQKPFMLKIQRRALASQNAVRFFSFNEYTFQTKRLINMMTELKNHPEFQVAQLMEKTGHEITKISLLGARRYLLNEDDSTIPTANRRLKILKYVDRTISGLFVSWVIYKIFSYWSIFI